MTEPFIFDGQHLPPRAGTVNRGDRRSVVQTHRGKRSLQPGQGLLVGTNGAVITVNKGDRVVPLIDGGYRVDRLIDDEIQDSE